MVLSIHDFGREADPCFAEAERLDPSEPRWPYLRGLARSGDNTAAAVPHLERAARLCGDMAAPHLRFAELLIERGQLERAEGEIRRVLRLNPRDARALLGLGRIALAQGHFPESRDYLQQSIESASDVRASRALLATVQQRLGNSAAAEQSLAAASGLPEDHVWPDPFLVEINQMRVGLSAALDDADTWLKQGRCSESVALLQQTVRNYPESMKAWLTLGRAWKQCTNTSSAEEALRRAVQVEPSSVEARVEYGIILYAQARYSESEASYREAIRINPNLAEAWFNLGLCLIGQQKIDAALDAFQTACRYKPDLVRAYTHLAESLARQGRTNEASFLLSQASRLNPTQGQAPSTFGTNGSPAQPNPQK